MKNSRNQFRDTQRVPFMFNKHRKPLPPQLEHRKTFEKIGFFVGKCRIVPRNVKGGKSKEFKECPS